MLPKRVYKIAGYVFLTVGFVMLLNSFQGITGLVILEGANIVRGFYLAMGFIVVGVLILMAQRGFERDLGRFLQEGLVSAEEFGRRIERMEPNKDKRFIVMDTSAIVPYAPPQIAHILKTYSEVIVPDSVLDEIKNVELRGVVERNSFNAEGFEVFKDQAAAILSRTEKPRLREYLMPFLDGTKTPTRRELSEMQEKTERVKKLMRKEGYSVGSGSQDAAKAVGRIREYLDRSCAVSQADTDVLACGMYAANQQKHTVIAEKDVDLRQAIDIIKDELPEIGINLDYVEPYAMHS